MPDSFLGVSITEACNVHDYMTDKGKTLGDFWHTQAYFIVNMSLILIKRSRNKFMSFIRLSIASVYFIVVVLKGEKHYWKNKEKNKDNSITFLGEWRTP